MNVIASWITCILLISFIHCKSQVFDLGECSTIGLSETGFDGLKEIIGDARIVIIGEQEHGVGTDYENFAFMVKFLHEEMNFNVVAQEYCFYTFHNINEQVEKGLSAQIFRKAMYWPQALAKENDLLLNYVDSQQKGRKPLMMEGFDPRIYDRKQFLSFCDSLILRSDRQVLDSIWVQSYRRILTNVLSLEYSDSLTSGQEKIMFLAQTDSVIKRMTVDGFDAREIQILKNLSAFAKNAWNLDALAGSDRYYYREQQMSDNIIWLAETIYPGQKLVIRMQNGHTAKNIFALKGAIPDSLLRDSHNVGGLLQHHFGSACKHFATTAYFGTYCKWDYIPISIPKPHRSSIESKLHRAGYKYAFLGLGHRSKQYMFFNDFNSWIEDRKIKMDFSRMFDGVIFIDQVSCPVKMQ